MLVTLPVAGVAAPAFVIQRCLYDERGKLQARGAGRQQAQTAFYDTTGTGETLGADRQARRAPEVN
jgi:hypothetical protein